MENHNIYLRIGIILCIFIGIPFVISEFVIDDLDFDWIYQALNISKLTAQDVEINNSLTVGGNITVQGYCNATNCYDNSDFLRGDDLGSHIASKNITNVSKIVGINQTSYIEFEEDGDVIIWI